LIPGGFTPPPPPPPPPAPPKFVTTREGSGPWRKTQASRFSNSRVDALAPVRWSSAPVRSGITKLCLNRRDQYSPHSPTYLSTIPGNLRSGFPECANLFCRKPRRDEATHRRWHVLLLALASIRFSGLEHDVDANGKKKNIKQWGLGCAHCVPTSSGVHLSFPPMAGIPRHGPFNPCIARRVGGGGGPPRPRRCAYPTDCRRAVVGPRAVPWC